MEELSANDTKDQTPENSIPKENQNNGIEIKEEKIKIASFLLDTEWYALPIYDIKEILLYRKITPIPGTPNFLLGVINMRGNIVAVVDLREFFELSVKEVSIDSKIIVLEIENKTLGIIVDFLGEVIDVNSTSIQTNLSGLTDKKAEYIKGIYRNGDQIVIILNFKKIINLNEFQSDNWGT
ncbi:chemotaxis protein CheW [Candidatus Poribacteria bacterium]|nr:chemotaxis protein CheW [Candidatus Poribacteria bacterium]